MFGLNQFWLAFIIKQIILLVVLIIAWLLVRRPLRQMRKMGKGDSMPVPPFLNQKGSRQGGEMPMPPFLKQRFERQSEGSSKFQTEETDLQLLKEVYARGLLTTDEFNQHCALLSKKQKGGSAR